MTRDFIYSVIGPELAKIRRRLAGMITRGFITLVKDSEHTQIIQAGVLHGETRDDIERFQNYGFSSVPLKDAEVLLLSLGGGRSHQICIVASDPKYRPTGMKAGDSAMYDYRGQAISLTADGISITTDKPVQINSSDITLGKTGGDKVITATRLKALVSTAMDSITPYDGGSKFATALMNGMDDAGSDNLKAD